jgi:methionine sulfoxide reductase heme-binding subunit
MNALWYFGRATGVTALALFSLVVVLGIVARSGRPLPGLPRFAVAAVHRQVSLAAVVFLALHIGTLLLDPYAKLRMMDLLVPFLARYRPVWQGLGTLGAELIVVLAITSLARNRLGPRVWRTLHWLAYLCWPVAVAHAVGTGTDRSSGWLLLTVAGCVLAVVGAVVWRMGGRAFADDPQSPRVAPPADLSGIRL